MTAKNNDKANQERTFAAAKALSIPVSTKHCIEICKSLRYKNTGYAKKFLQDVAELKRAVPFKTFNKDTGHKPGMAAGRFPQKAAKEILKLVSSVEANAQVKGLNTSNLKITKLLANKAAIPMGGGRHRTGTKRSNVVIEVAERKEEKKISKTEAKQEIKTEEQKTEVKKAVKAALVNEKENEKEKDEKKIEAVTEEPTPVKKSRPEASRPEVSKLEASKPETAAKSSSEPVKEVQELSPAELLKKAQKKADELNKMEKKKESNEEVSKLYRELQKKGSLRNEGGSKK